MAYTGINSGNVKINNRSAILKLLNNEGASTRKDIAQRLGLTPATVTLITSEMISSGILCERGEMEEEKRAGRRKVLIEINENYRYVLTICIEELETVISVCNLKGCSLTGKSFATDKTLEPKEFLKSIASESIRLMWENGIAREMILGVGVSIPGRVDRENGISQHAYRIWEESVPIADTLREILDYPIIVENNVQAFAVGELIFGRGTHHENFMVLKWGPGVGAAVVIENHVYETKTRHHSEIGHLIVQKNGKKCRCGKNGCLETVVSTHAINDLIHEACISGKYPELAKAIRDDIDELRPSTLNEWIQNKGELLQPILEPVFEVLGRTIANTATMIDPERIVLYGRMFEIPGFEEKIREQIYAYSQCDDPDLCVLSVLEDRRWFIGPLAVTVNELFLLSGGETIQEQQ